MNGLAQQRGSRFFVAERHHNHSDVTEETFYEEKKTYNLVTVSTRSKQNTTMQSIPWFLRFYFFILTDNSACHGSELSCFLTRQPNQTNSG